MKNLTTIFLLLLFATTPCFPKTYSQRAAFVDEYFDSFKSNIHWSEQRVRLDNFASRISSEPRYIGYIAFESSKNESLEKAKAKIARMVSYLTYQRKIEKSRIMVVYLGKAENPKIILQPVMEGTKPPFNQKSDKAER
jgi:hypothetical protein